VKDLPAKETRQAGATFRIVNRRVMAGAVSPPGVPATAGATGIRRAKAAKTSSSKASRKSAVKAAKKTTRKATKRSVAIKDLEIKGSTKRPVALGLRRTR